MIKASDWVAEYCSVEDSVALITRQGIKRIQDDAYRAGLMKAVAITRAERNMQFPKKHAVWNSMCSDIAVSITREAGKIPVEPEM